MNHNNGNGTANGKTTIQNNEQKLLSIFSDGTFNKEEAADVLGISVSGAYKMLQRMADQKLLIARKESKQWVYRRVTSQTTAIQTTEYLDLKIVAFAGMFDGGTLRLKDLVYFAGGAPSDTIPAFTNYVVIGRRGKESQAYKKALKMINTGAIIELSEDELRDICSGKTPAPERDSTPHPNVVVYPANKESQMESEMNEIEVFNYKRESFERRYGVLQPDGSRKK
jgi:hypothetical protein